MTYQVNQFARAEDWRFLIQYIHINDGGIKPTAESKTATEKVPKVEC